jgi:hypothetical protein
MNVNQPKGDPVPLTIDEQFLRTHEKEVLESAAPDFGLGLGSWPRSLGVQATKREKGAR